MYELANGSPLLGKKSALTGMTIVKLENRCARERTESSNISLSATLRSSSFGWLTPAGRAKSFERGVSSDLQSAEADFRSAKAEALAKEDGFEYLPDSPPASRSFFDPDGLPSPRLAGSIHLLTYTLSCNSADRALAPADGA
jgi:hypothetical protein